MKIAIILTAIALFTVFVSRLCRLCKPKKPTKTVVPDNVEKYLQQLYKQDNGKETS